MSDLTLSEYSKEVSALAEAIAKEAVEYNRDVSDVLHETIDGHRWVIYTAYHFDVLQHSPNDGAYFDEIGPITLTSLDLAPIVYVALAADVRAELPEMSECSECGKVCLTSELDEDVCKVCKPPTYKVWDVRECVYEGTDRDAALAAWENIPESRRNDRALCQIDVNGENATTRMLVSE